MLRSRSALLLLLAIVAIIGWLSWPHLSSISAASLRSDSLRKSGGVVPARTEDLASSPHIFRTQNTGQAIAHDPKRDLRLLGTHQGATPLDGTATIGESAKTAHVYSAGAILETGAEIAEISANYVVLEKDGVSSVVGIADSVTGSEDRPSAQRLKVGTARVEDTIRHVPAYRDGKAIGLTLYPGTRKQQFESLGLQSGDVLVALGSAQEPDSAAMTAQLESLAQGGVLAGHIQRGATRIPISLDGAVLASKN
jgi:type II secretory pathway component PulC